LALRPKSWLRDYRRQYVARYLLALCKARAKKQGIPFNITEDDIRIPSVCPALGIPLVNFTSRGPTDSSATIDRVDPTKGYVRGNIAVISSLANRIKNNANATDILKVGRWLKGLTRRRKIKN
jgi:hypothetical protein